MLFKPGRRLLFMAIPSFLLLLVFSISCTASGTPLPDVPANENTAIPAEAAAYSALDIKSFRAQPKTIKAGETTTLVWNVTGASELSIDPVIGHIAGNTGSISIAPKETTLYTLIVTDGHLKASMKSLVIVKTADGSIVWPNINSDNSTAELLYEGWSYYPNKYVDWTIDDSRTDSYGDSSDCWHVGYITNHHSKWMMTEVTVGAADVLPAPVTGNLNESIASNENVQNRVVMDFILPGRKGAYTASVDCTKPAELKWKWKLYQ